MKTCILVTGNMMLIAILCAFALFQQTPLMVNGLVRFSQLSVDNATNREIIIDLHNDFRRNATPTAMNMLKTMWSDEARQTAEKWAKTCNQFHSIPSTRTITRSLGSSCPSGYEGLCNNVVELECGENLFMSSYPATWAEAITALHSEYSDFEFGKGPKVPNAMIGHYTQIMWYSSYLIGCYVERCLDAEFEYYFVCHYCPAGNIADKIATPYKSGPTCADCPKSCENGLCTNSCPYKDKYNNCKELKEGCQATFTCTNKEII